MPGSKRATKIFSRSLKISSQSPLRSSEHLSKGDSSQEQHSDRLSEWIDSQERIPLQIEAYTRRTARARMASKLQAFDDMFDMGAEWGCEEEQDSSNTQSHAGLFHTPLPRLIPSISRNVGGIDKEDDDDYMEYNGGYSYDDDDRHSDVTIRPVAKVPDMGDTFMNDLSFQESLAGQERLSGSIPSPDVNRGLGFDCHLHANSPGSFESTNTNITLPTSKVDRLEDLDNVVVGELSFQLSKCEIEDRFRNPNTYFKKLRNLETVNFYGSGL